MSLFDSHCHALLGLYNPLEPQQVQALVQNHGLSFKSASEECLTSILNHEHYKERMHSFASSTIEHFNLYTVNYLDALVNLFHAHNCTALSSSRYSLGVGLHPYYVATQSPALLEQELLGIVSLLEHFLAPSSLLASSLGEIGLDRRLSMPLSVQLEWLKRFIQSTAHFNLPYSFHCVGAYDELAKLIKDLSLHKRVGFPKTITEKKLPYSSVQVGTIHGFNGSSEQGRKLVNLGLKLGLGKSLLAVQNTKKFTALLNLVPPESLVFESDYDGTSGPCYDATLIPALQARLITLREPLKELW